MNDFASLKRVSAVAVRKKGGVRSGGIGFDTRIDTFMGEMCAILKIRCHQDQAQKDPENITPEHYRRKSICIVKTQRSGW